MDLDSEIDRLWHGERAGFDRLFAAAGEVRAAVGAGSGGRPRLLERV